CRDAMGIAAGVGARRPAAPSLRFLRARTRRPTLPPGDRPLRLLLEPVAATTAPHRDSRCETASVSGLHPACREEAGSPRVGTGSGRSTSLPVLLRPDPDVGGSARSGGGLSRPSPSSPQPPAVSAGAGPWCPSASSTSV